MRSSLTLRLALLTALWVAAGLAVTGWFVSGVAGRQIEAAADARLSALMDAIVAAAAMDEAGRPRLERPPADAELERPLSGRYWRVAGPGGVASSRSLWDAELPPPLRGPAGPGAATSRDVRGPRGERLLLLERTVELPGAAGPLAVQVAMSRDATDAELARLRRGVAFGFGLLGLGLVGGVAALAVWGLRPLRTVRRALAEVRAGARDCLAVPAPAEIAPLVEEVDALIAQNQATVERARAHVGNLAHALKTPVAVLVNAAGENADPPRPGLVLAQAREIERVVQHHLARARTTALPGPGGLAGRASALAAAEEVAAALRRLQAERGLTIAVEGEAALRVRADRQDLVEIVGNLMENACKWAASRVEVRVLPTETPGRRPGDSPAPMVLLVVEDDGPGLPEDQAANKAAADAMSRGVRLDEAAPGTGLGLAIVADLAALYGGRLTLGRSGRLHGASARLELPAAADAPRTPGRQPPRYGAGTARETGGAAVAAQDPRGPPGRGRPRMDRARRLLLAVPFGASACRGRGDPPPLDAADNAFVDQAVEASLGMVALGQLAARRSSSPMVRQFAQRVVAERSMVDRELAATARGRGVPPPTGPDPRDAEARRALSAYSGAAFDQRYMAHQLQEHERQRALFIRQAEAGTDPELRTFAERYLPVVEAHARMARAVLDSVGDPAR